MTMHEFDLENGRGFRIECPGRTNLVATVQDDGRRELQFVDKRSEDLLVTLSMDDDDARRLGAVLTGTRYRPQMPIEARGRVGELVVEWVHVDDDSLVVGKSLRELDLHRRTGMTVVSLVDENGVATTPRADTVLRAGDHVVVVGQLRQLEAFVDLLTG